MKLKKAILTILTCTLLLTSCTGKNQNNSDFVIVSGIQSVYNDILITVNSGTLYYTDLLENITMPVCVRPNCSHKVGSESCTARGRADNMGGFSAPFIHDENLYFFFRMDDITLYKSGLDGGNRQALFTYNPPKNTNDIMHSGGTLRGELYDDEKLYFLIGQGHMVKIDGSFVNSGLMKYMIYCYDLVSNKYEIVYETDYLSQSGWQMSHGNHSRQYMEDDRFNIMKAEDLRDLMLDPDSDFHKSSIHENGYFDTSSHEWVVINNIPWAGVYVIGDYGYYMVDHNLYKHHLQTREEEIIFYDIRRFALADNTVFVYTNADNYKSFYLKNDTWVEIPHTVFIRDETENYFLVYGDDGFTMGNWEWAEQYAILKSDYYAGNDTSFEISPPD